MAGFGHARTVGLLTAALALVIACSGTVTPTPTQAPTAAPTTATEVSPLATSLPQARDLVIPRPSGDLAVKVGVASPVSLSTVPLSMTVDRLKSMGWNTSLVEFTGSALNTQALGQGDVQFSQAQVLDAARARQKGGSISWLAENNASELVLIARSSITECKGLSDKRVGFQGAAAPVTVMTQAWLRACGATAQVVVMAGGENRAIALQRGQLDASTVQVSEWLALQAQAGSAFHLIETGSIFDISAAHIWVNETWADTRAEVAATFMAEILRTFRMIREDQAAFKTALLTYVPATRPELVDGLIKAYIDIIEAWPVNGGDSGAVTLALDYYTKLGDLQAGLTADGLTLTGVRTTALQLAGQAK